MWKTFSLEKQTPRPFKWWQTRLDHLSWARIYLWIFRLNSNHRFSGFDPNLSFSMNYSCLTIKDPSFSGYWSVWLVFSQVYSFPIFWAFFWRLYCLQNLSFWSTYLNPCSPDLLHSIIKNNLWSVDNTVNCKARWTLLENLRNFLAKTSRYRLITWVIKFFGRNCIQKCIYWV